MSSEWFAKPQITLEDLERRLVHIVQGEDSVRASPRLSHTFSLHHLRLTSTLRVPH
jgi:hypothetical protein